MTCAPNPLHEAIDDFLAYTPTGQTDYGYALGWATAQHKLLVHLVDRGVLTRAEAGLLSVNYPDRKHFLNQRRAGRPPKA